MDRIYLLVFLVVCILGCSYGYRRRHDSHDDDGHDHDHGHHDHDIGHRRTHGADPHQHFFAKVHYPQSRYGGVGHGPYQHYHSTHGHGYGDHHGGHHDHRRGHHSDSEDDDHHSQEQHHSDSEDDDHHGSHRRHYDHRRRHHSDSEDDDHHDDHHGQRRRHHSESEDDDHHDDHNEDHHEKIWRFQIGDNFGAFEYLDNDGHARGFHIDLLRAVCERAHKKCYFLVDTYQNCWNTRGGQELPGLGLLDHYYDGCIGNLPTPDRLNSFNFTLPFTPNIQCGLLHKPGDDHSMDSHNVTGLKIGFVAGWALSKRCFERQEGFTGNSPGKYTPVLFETHKSMIRALLQNEVSAVLTADVFDSDDMHVTLVEPKFSCTLGGSSVMTNYGSGVIHWWNEAFLEMREDGSFRRLCEKAKTDHSAKGKIYCKYD